MNLYIGENIKRLRRERGITQETLADAMNVSCPAVSKWERGETFPDITMVLPLAAYFGVSTDELLGLDEAKNAQKIADYLNEYYLLGAQGKVFEKFDLMKKAHEEFPYDWRLLEEYMWQLNYDPHCTDPYGNEVHKEELYRLCKRVLDECTLDHPRYAALSILSGLYVLDGDMGKAVETVKRLPPSYFSQEQELENCYDRGTEEWWNISRDNIWTLTHDLQVKIRNAALYSGDLREKIRLLKKAVALIELIFDEEDYGFCHYDLAELYLWIANAYGMLEEYPAAFEYYEKGFAHAKMYDDLPKISVHTSFLVRGKVQDMMKICAGAEENEVARELAYVRGNAVYEKMREMPEMRAILAKYEPFAGKKKDYANE